MSTLAVIWRTAGLLLATSADSILEVLPPLYCSPTAAVPDWVRGLFTYRGRLIPLVDSARLLGASTAPDRMVNRVLVVRVSSHHGDSTIDWPVGLWVENVLELERIDFTGASTGAGDVANRHPGFATDAGRFLGPVAQTEWGQVQLVNPAEIFSDEQVRVLTERLTESDGVAA
jgi:chemotaxis-related protein WspB